MAPRGDEEIDFSCVVQPTILAECLRRDEVAEDQPHQELQDAGATSADFEYVRDGDSVTRSRLDGHNVSDTADEDALIEATVLPPESDSRRGQDVDSATSFSLERKLHVPPGGRYVWMLGVPMLDTRQLARCCSRIDTFGKDSVCQDCEQGDLLVAVDYEHRDMDEPHSCETAADLDQKSDKTPSLFQPATDHEEAASPTHESHESEEMLKPIEDQELLDDSLLPRNRYYQLRQTSYLKSMFESQKLQDLTYTGSVSYISSRQLIDDTVGEIDAEKTSTSEVQQPEEQDIFNYLHDMQKQSEITRNWCAAVATSDSVHDAGVFMCLYLGGICLVLLLSILRVFFPLITNTRLGNVVAMVGNFEATCVIQDALSAVVLELFFIRSFLLGYGPLSKLARQQTKLFVSLDFTVATKRITCPLILAVLMVIAMETINFTSVETVDFIALNTLDVAAAVRKMAILSILKCSKMVGLCDRRDCSGRDIRNGFAKRGTCQDSYDQLSGSVTAKSSEQKPIYVLGMGRFSSQPISDERLPLVQSYKAVRQDYYRQETLAIFQRTRRPPVTNITQSTVECFSSAPLRVEGRAPIDSQLEQCCLGESACFSEALDFLQHQPMTSCDSRVQDMVSLPIECINVYQNLSYPTSKDSCFPIWEVDNWKEYCELTTLDTGLSNKVCCEEHPRIGNQLFTEQVDGVQCEETPNERLSQSLIAQPQSCDSGAQCVAFGKYESLHADIVPCKGELEYIKEFFWNRSRNRGLTANGPRVQLICGGAGIGKSFLAKEYAAVEKDRYPDGVFEVDAPTAALSYQQMEMTKWRDLRDFKDSNPDDGSEVTCRNVKYAVRNDLFGYLYVHQRSLLILDDVCDMDSLPDVLCCLPALVHVIVTTRRTTYDDIFLDNYEIMIKQVCETNTLIDRIDTLRFLAGEGQKVEHSSCDIVIPGAAGVVVCSPAGNIVCSHAQSINFDVHVHSVPAVQDWTFSVAEVTDNDEFKLWSDDVRDTAVVRRRLELVYDETSELSELWTRQDPQNARNQYRGEDFCTTVIQKEVFGKSSKTEDWNDEEYQFSFHQPVNIFRCGNDSASLSADRSPRFPVYQCVTSWSELPVDDCGPATPTTNLGDLSSTVVKAPGQQERLLVQIRNIVSKNFHCISNHPLITRLCLNIFVIDMKEFLACSDSSCSSLLSLASRLALQGSVNEPRHMRVQSLPLLIVGVICRSTTEKDKTEFETRISKTLKGVLPLVRSASAKRLCYYIQDTSSNSTAGQEEQAMLEATSILGYSDDSEIIRSAIRSYAKKWRPERQRAEREMALLKRRLRGQREHSMEARNYFSTLQATGQLSRTDILRDLEYFHEKGVVFYLPSLQAPDILLDLDWLCDKIDTFIDACPETISPNHLIDLSNLKETGITRKRLVDELIGQGPDASIRETLMRIFDYYGICLQPPYKLEARPKSLYVDPYVAVPPRVVSAAMSRTDVVVPHRLPSTLPNITEDRTAIAPLAIRCKDKEIPLLLYHKLAWSLQDRFSVGWEMSMYEARFCVEPGYTLDVIYKKSFIALMMRIRTKGSALSEKVGVVCDTVRKFAVDAMVSVKTQYRLDGFQWEIVGIKVSDEHQTCCLDQCQFISGTDASLALDDMWLCFSETGQDCETPETLFLWFNLSGGRLKDSDSAKDVIEASGRETLASSFVIPSHFTRLCQSIDAHKVLKFLSDEQLLSLSGVDYCKELAENAFVALRVLRLLNEQGATGDDVLRRALCTTGQDQIVAEFWSTVTPTGDEKDTEPSLSTSSRQKDTPDDPSVFAPSWNVTVSQEPFPVQPEEKSSGASNVSRGLPLGGRSGTVTNLSPFSASPPPASVGTGSSIPPAVSRQPQNLELSSQGSGGSGSGRQPDVGIQRPASGFQLGSGIDFPRESFGSPALSPSVNVSHNSDSSLLLEKQRSARTPVLQQDVMRPVIPVNVSRFPSSQRPQTVEEGGSQTMKSEEPQIHPIFEAKYYHIERATDHFNDRPLKDGGKRLGSGSFGTVYHGILHSERGDKFEVAIKRLKKASSLNPTQVELSRKQFGTEMNILTRYVDRNIVQLVGFSSDGPELCLIYEYMQRGALSHRLDCKDGTPALEWRTRISIAEDVASAIDFLHNQYTNSVIHRDVKSSNVLIGGGFEAKLSDFGLAVLEKELDGALPSPGSSVGTRPYMPPEAFEGVITTKVDVYGFGMILYELATGLPPYSSKKKQNLKTYIDDIETQHVDLRKMLDPKGRFPRNRDDTYGVDLLQIAKRATDMEFNKRPTIKELHPKLKALREKSRRR